MLDNFLSPLCHQHGQNMEIIQHFRQKINRNRFSKVITIIIVQKIDQFQLSYPIHTFLPILKHYHSNSLYHICAQFDLWSFFKNELSEKIYFDELIAL